jgi:hypothetical protein
LIAPGYPLHVINKENKVLESKFHLFSSPGVLQTFNKEETNIMVNSLASEGQDGCPVMAGNKLIGLFAGQDTDDSENICVNLITKEVAKWINDTIAN